MFNPNPLASEDIIAANPTACHHRDESPALSERPSCLWLFPKWTTEASLLVRYPLSPPQNYISMLIILCLCVCVCAGLGADFVLEKSISFLEIGLPSQAVTLLFYFFMAKFSAKACVQQCSHGVFISAKILGYTFIFYFHSNTLSIFPIILCVSVWENFGAPAMMDTKICIQLFFFFFWLCSSSWEAAAVVQSFSQVPSQQQGSGFESHAFYVGVLISVREWVGCVLSWTSATCPGCVLASRIHRLIYFPPILTETERPGPVLCVLALMVFSSCLKKMYVHTCRCIEQMCMQSQTRKNKQL